MKLEDMTAKQLRDRLDSLEERDDALVQRDSVLSGIEKAMYAKANYQPDAAHKMWEWRREIERELYRLHAKRNKVELLLARKSADFAKEMIEDAKRGWEEEDREDTQGGLH